MIKSRVAEEELQGGEANIALGRLYERNRFMLLESLLKELRELQRQHLKGKETSFIKPKDEKEMDNEMNFDEGETNKERQKNKECLNRFNSHS